MLAYTLAFTALGLTGCGGGAVVLLLLKLPQALIAEKKQVLDKAAVGVWHGRKHHEWAAICCNFCRGQEMSGFIPRGSATPVNDFTVTASSGSMMQSQSSYTLVVQ
jgi:hypothetical protein